MNAKHPPSAGCSTALHKKHRNTLAASLYCASALLAFVACTSWITDEELKSESVLRPLPASQVCHTLFVPDEHRSYSLDVLAIADMMDTGLEQRTRVITIHEARNKFPSLKEPTGLPEGLELSSVIIDEKREANDRHSPYLPCSVTLSYTSTDSSYPWLEIGHPDCSPVEDDRIPTAQASDWRQVTANGQPATILDVAGRDTISLISFESLVCLKVPRVPTFNDQTLIDIAESLERMEEGR